MEVDSAWGGAKTFFSGEGLIVLRVSGHGEVLVASYGAIEAGNSLPASRSRLTPATWWRGRKCHVPGPQGGQLEVHVPVRGGLVVDLTGPV